MKQTFTFLTLIFTLFAAADLTAQSCPSTNSGTAARFQNSGLFVLKYETAGATAMFDALTTTGTAIQVTGTVSGGTNDGNAYDLSLTKAETRNPNDTTLRPDDANNGNNGESAQFTGVVTFTLAAGAPIVCNYVAGVLPVLYADFQAENQGKHIVLTWTTGSEINNDYFVIERSTDGKTFTAIGEVTGAGNSDDFVDYRFTDAQPAAGVNYYRLRQVDFDGTESLSSVTIVKTDTRAAADLSVYPTVTEGELTVDLTAKDSAALNAQILTATGATVRTLSLAGGEKVSVNTADLQAGIYFLRVQTAQGISVAEFVVK